MEKWNLPDKVEIDGKEYTVIFNVQKKLMEGSDEEVENLISSNTDYQNNYIRLEKGSVYPQKGWSLSVSQTDKADNGGGGNTGIWYMSEHHTTPAHEFGHLLDYDNGGAYGYHDERRTDGKVSMMTPSNDLTNQEMDHREVLPSIIQTVFRNAGNLQNGQTGQIGNLSNKKN